MPAPISTKPGFRVAVSKRDLAPAIEVLEPGRGCALFKKDQLTLILLGEVLDENGFLTGYEILERFQRNGTAFTAGLDGAFVLVILGSDTAPAVVITDPLNSLKCFLEETLESYTLVSSLCFLPERERAIDSIALASFLANGVVYNQRTIFSGVRALQRASIHTIGGQPGISSAAYWRYEFDHAYASRNRADLRRELADLLLKAAARRIRPDETIYLSLSGGYDSTCILGLFSRLRPERVECFSYVTNPDGDGTDEQVAAEMCAQAGFPHRVIKAFNQDLPSLVRRNAEMGECRANFCGELDAWQALQEQLPDDAVMFVGDECFGWYDGRIKSDADMLAVLPIKETSALAAFADCIDLPALSEAYDREVREIARAARQPDGHDAKDFVYLDQRLPNVILPWRELFTGCRCPVRNILLDRRIIDFISHLPSAMRRDKNLYKETVREMFSDLLRIRRAFRPTSHYLATAVYENREALRQELLGHASLIDPWLKLDRCAELARPVQRVDSISWKKRTVLLAKKLLKQNALANAIKGKFPPLQFPISAPTLLLRILTLRHYLSKR